MELERALSLLSENNGLFGKQKLTAAENLVPNLSQLGLVVEILPPNEQDTFVQYLLPWSFKVLDQFPPSFVPFSIDHRLRNGLLLVLKSICNIVEPLKPFIDLLMQNLLAILRDDNEENGILAIHMIIELNKAHRLALEPYAQSLVDYVLSAFESFSEICQTVFDMAKREEKSLLGSNRRSTKFEINLLKASSSFKVLIECPVMIVLLFQIHRRLVADNIGRFSPHVIRALSVEIDPPNPPNISAVNPECLTTSTPMGLAFADYVSAQVKTLSFLAYISRGFASVIRPHYSLIPVHAIRLLKCCPIDLTSARKELLVATRHILSTEIRQAFVPFLDQLLDQDLLLGEGFTSYFVLRPLALSMLADLVHHVRSEIPLPLLNRIIRVYSQALHDPSLPIGVQTMSAKLLVNLVDALLSEEIGTLETRRNCLVTILFSLLSKFEWTSNFVNKMKSSPNPRIYSPFFDDSQNTRPIETDAIILDPNRDNFRDLKFLLKTLISGLKNILFAIKTLTLTGDSYFTVEEGKEFVLFFQNGIISFEIFRLSEEHLPSSASAQTSISRTFQPDALLNLVSINQDEKEIYEQFAYLFTIVDAPLFQEVFSVQMESLVHSMSLNHSLLIIPQYFLAISGISRNFAGLLIKFLMENFDGLISPNHIVGAINLRLFKLLFLAVSVYPDENESVIQPYLTDIIMNCLKKHHHSARSLNYFLLLRSLFRSIGGGRFDALYKEVLPLLSIILEELGKLPSTTNDPYLRELYVELCLTTPVRLSVLLPYLGHLMKPLVLALQSGPELVSQGLRTLELCIDNLTQDFLEPIVFPILDELLQCLWGLLRPPPANQAHSHAAMRILGKMGGRSHRYLPLPKPISYEENPDDHEIFKIGLNFGSDQLASLSLDKIVLAASSVLDPNSKVTSEQKITAFNLIINIIRALVTTKQSEKNQRDLILPFKSFRSANATYVTKQSIDQKLERLSLTSKFSSLERFSRSFCQTVFCSLFWASNDQILGQEASNFILEFYTYISFGLYQNSLLSTFLPLPDVFYDILIDISCETHVNLVAEVLRRIYQVNLKYSPQDCVILSVFIEKLITSCYRAKSEDKLEVLKLVDELGNLDLSLSWIWIFEVRLTRGILYVMKSLQPGLVSLHGQEVTETLVRFLRLCNRQDDREMEDIRTRRTQYFNQLLSLLVSEVSNANALVRSAVQSCFQLLADVTGSEVTELLLPFKERLLAPIFTKPLRALPPNLQIGYIDAVTYCLNQRPPLLEVNEELLRLLNEAIALSEADDSFLATKTNQIANSASILQLRLVCIKLLSIALSTTEFGMPHLHAVRNMIVAVFFKSLYSRSTEVVEASRIALEQVMVNQHKLPKDLLQTALRPVLTNLAEAKRLTLPGLEGLRRVLELLTSYFKAEIGKKLLDHLAAWSEPKKILQDVAGKPICECLEVKMIASILDIFHLLPPSGNVFVSDLISVVLSLEKLIQRSISSPFRPPLQRLLSHYPSESAEYLLSHLNEPAVVEVFAHVIQMVGSESIVEALIEQYTRLPIVGGLNVLKILEKIILKLDSEQAASELLRSLWNSCAKYKDLSLEDSKELKELLKISLNYLNSHLDHFRLSFQIFSIFNISLFGTTSELSQVLDASMNHCSNSDISVITDFLIFWSNYHTSPEQSTASKIQALRLIIFPFLKHLSKRTEYASILNSDLIKIVTETLDFFKPSLDRTQNNMLAVEELQIILFLSQMLPKLNLSGLILSKAQFADPTVRFSAYAGLILNHSSEGILLNVLPHLLKMPTTETRPIVRQVLQIFFEKLMNLDSVELLEVVLAELQQTLFKESSSTVLISIIWQCLIGVGPNGDRLLSKMTSLLMSSFIHSAYAVFLIPECKMLPFELLNMLTRVSKDFSLNHYQSGCSLSVRLLLTMSMTDMNQAHNGDSGSSGQISTSLQDKSEPTAIDPTAVLMNFVEAFSPAIPVALPLGSFDKILNSENDDHIANQPIALRLSKTLLSYRNPIELATDFVVFGPIILSMFKHSSPLICLELMELIELVFTKANPFSFTESLQNCIVEQLLSGKNIPICLKILQYSTNLLNDEKVSIFLSRLLTKVARDFVSKSENLSGNAGKIENDFFVNHFLVPLISLLVVSNSDNIKASLLLAIQLLWERCMDKTVLSYLLDLFITWTKIEFSSQGKFSMKELSMILLTPSKFDQMKDEGLMEKYLDLVLSTYKNPLWIGSELTNRWEGSFLQGLAAPSKRTEFINFLNQSISSDLSIRLVYLLGGVRWNLAGSFDWMPTVIHLLLLIVHEVYILSPALTSGSVEVDGFSLPTLSRNFEIASILKFLQFLLYCQDGKIALYIWDQLFPSLWCCLSAKDRISLSKALTKLLASYETKTSSMKLGNPIYTLLSAASLCFPPPSLPAHILKFTAQVHKTWYASLFILENSRDFTVKDCTKAACCLYKDLAETDLMFGSLKSCVTLPESNSALSFSMTQRWNTTQRIAEAAQDSVRTGTLPFNDFEMDIWEDIWLESAKKLQQWDLVSEVAKIDEDPVLSLECLWRLGDWLQGDTPDIAASFIKSVPNIRKPRLKFLETFLVLNNIREVGTENNVGRFQNSLEEAIQESLLEWNLLPDYISRSHVDLLHTFQMFVEIQEAMTIYSGISGGSNNPLSLINRPQFLTDLKGLLSTWRERLPNRMDDLNIWSDLLAWRQHIFSSLNVAFQTFAPSNENSQASANQSAHPFAFRGYHELAWLINKFARVCRKNGLPEVCLSFLNRIYTLPNIEIQDAFSKLKEQTLCYVDVPSDLSTALEVINATNLNYFSAIQKAEFFSMKGHILSKLGLSEDANRVFAQAVQIDLNIGKGWAYWGQFNDQRFQQTHDITLAVSAINCYLQASTLFKISKARRFGARILWLLTFEDAVGSMAKSFELYNNDLPTWFWISFIPQLLSSLARKDARHARFLLIKIAKSYPQALYLSLRTANDEYRLLYGSLKNSQTSATTNRILPIEDTINSTTGEDFLATISGSSSGNSSPETISPINDNQRNPTEHTEDILAILKTGYPLLALSIENMIDHVIQRLRSSADEDLYRVVVTLLSEAFQQLMVKFNSGEASAGAGMDPSLKRVSYMLGSSSYLSTNYKSAFDEDFGDGGISLDEIIDTLQKWRIDLSEVVDNCPTSYSLESLSRFLAEFEFQKYDEVEIPGQYLLLKDNNQDFLKIERFDPTVQIVRRHGSSFRRLSIQASNGSKQQFLVQNPSARQSRREEKLMQLFRSIRRGLKENPNARRRGLEFTVPLIVPISAHVRLLQEDIDQTSFEDLYDNFCRLQNIETEDVLLYYRDRFVSESNRLQVHLRKGNVEVLNLRVDIFQKISLELVPNSVMDTFIRQYIFSIDEYWLFRKTFTRQYACSLFLTYVLALGHRYPHKIGFSKAMGTVFNTEILPTLNPNGQITLVEAVPFRLTPNLQQFMTPLYVEGLFTPALHSCAEVYCKPDSELAEFLPMVIRDELMSWVLQNQSSKSRFVFDKDGKMLSFRHDLEILETANIDERQFLGRVIQNCELTMKRCQTLACIKEMEKATDCKTSSMQTILDLISCATNPQKLALMDAHWHPWL